MEATSVSGSQFLNASLPEPEQPEEEDGHDSDEQDESENRADEDEENEDIESSAVSHIPTVSSARDEITKSAGLQFPVKGILACLGFALTTRGGRPLSVETDAGVAAAAFLEYLSAELLELAGNAAKDCKKTMIIPRHVNLAVFSDQELQKSFMVRGVYELLPGMRRPKRDFIPPVLNSIVVSRRPLAHLATAPAPSNPSEVVEAVVLDAYSAHADTQHVQCQVSGREPSLANPVHWVLRPPNPERQYSVACDDPVWINMSQLKFHKPLKAVLGQVHPSTRIRAAAVDYVNAILHHWFTRLEARAFLAAQKNPQCQVLTVEHITTAALGILTGELLRHALSEIKKSVTKYQSTVPSSVSSMPHTAPIQILPVTTNPLSQSGAVSGDASASGFNPFAPFAESHSPAPPSWALQLFAHPPSDSPSTSGPLSTPQPAFPTPSVSASRKDGPKRPLSAFMLFSQSIRDEVKREQPASSITEIMKAIGDRWVQASDDAKQPFIAEAARQKAQYEAELAGFKRNAASVSSTATSDSNNAFKCALPPQPKQLLLGKAKPLAQPSAFMLFSAKIRAQLKAEDPNKSFLQMARDISDRWRALSNEEKEVYEKEAKQIKEEDEST